VLLDAGVGWTWVVLVVAFAVRTGLDGLGVAPPFEEHGVTPAPVVLRVSVAAYCCSP
jgi:hypothetical protein